jgi:prepilin-type N-terminal cleavage/methylation domain-containing protein
VNTERASATGRSRGMTLIEVMAALAILGVSLLGLTGGLVIAATANGRASRRTQMAEFAQSRIERLTAATRKDICTATFNLGAVDCSRMASGGTFDPTAAPNTGGWMLDVLDRASAAQPSVGVDQMAGPVVVLGDLGAIDEAATLTARSALAADWAGGGSGCAAAMVTTNMLCRELHVEVDPTSSFYHIWVRVSRGGRWTDGPITMEGMVAK